MKRPSLAIYTTTTVDFGYKQSLLNVFGVPLQKDPDIEKVVYHNKNLNLILRICNNKIRS